MSPQHRTGSSTAGLSLNLLPNPLLTFEIWHNCFVVYYWPNFSPELYPDEHCFSHLYKSENTWSQRFSCSVATRATAVTVQTVQDENSFITGDKLATTNRPHDVTNDSQGDSFP